MFPQSPAHSSRNIIDENDNGDDYDDKSDVIKKKQATTA
jgi:hypothetical protein